MNFKDIMRGPDKGAFRGGTPEAIAYAKANFGKSRDTVVAVVKEHPGLTARELSEFMPAKLIRQLPALAERGHLAKKAVGSGTGPGKRYKYYDPDQDITLVTVNPKPEPVLVNRANTIPNEIEQLAREFVWETGDMNLRHFVDWVKTRS